jgi:hypothetical protein
VVKTPGERLAVYGALLVLVMATPTTPRAPGTAPLVAAALFAVARWTAELMLAAALARTWRDMRRRPTLYEVAEQVERTADQAARYMASKPGKGYARR